KNGFVSGEYPHSLQGYDAIAMGIGMGREQETERFLYQIIEHVPCPLILDADGLNHLKYNLEALRRRKHPVILTPHPGEMARLMDTTIPEIMQAPFRYSLEFAKTYQVYIVLKGRFTII